MSDTMPGDPGVAGVGLVAKQVETCLDWLRQAGELVVGTGCLASGSTALYLHTDFGPAGQDKETNQDYALAWVGGASAAEAEPLMVLALADGLTSSYRSEWSSQLACAVAMQTLVRELTAPLTAEGVGPSSREQARRAFAAAGHSLQEVAQAMAAKPEESCPPGTFLSTWKYILRKGGLLQTTLTLAWLRGGLLHVAMLGDGGALWRDNDATPLPVDEVLAQADLSTNTVNALGPGTPEPSALVFLVERPWTGRKVCALFSDGVGRGVQLTDSRPITPDPQKLGDTAFPSPALAGTLSPPDGERETPAETFPTQHETATDCRRRREEAKRSFPCPTTPPYVGAYNGFEISRPGGLSLLDRVTELQAQGHTNPAKTWIDQVVQEGHPAFDDNLTLAILRRE